MEGGWKTPPPRVSSRAKSPGLIGLIKVLPIFRLYQKILHRFVSFCISLIFTYRLFVEKKLVTIKHFLLSFFGGQNLSLNGNFCLYFENSRKEPIFKASNESNGNKSTIVLFYSIFRTTVEVSSKLYFVEIQ